MLQQKRMNPQSKHQPESRSPKHPRKPTKLKQIKSKIFKNLSEFPIQLTHDAKENQPSNHPQKPTSSLSAYDTHIHKPTRPVRFESAMGQYPDHKDCHNRKRLSLDSTGKRYERDSLISKNSVSKKMSRNNKSIEEGLNVKIAQDRRRSNVSCVSAYDDGQYRTSKKNSVKPKRPTVINMQLPNKQKDKENKEPKNVKVNDKSRSKSKKGRKKSVVLLEKSKGSTAAINFPQKGFNKKKQSVSTAQIGAQPNKKKKKPVKKQSPRAEGNQQNDQFSLEQYPINKYDIDNPTEKVKRRPSKPQTKSKSRKGSSSKSRHKSGFLEIDYVSCINIPSNSSGLIDSGHSKYQNKSNIKIIENWEYNYFGEDKTGSVNLDQIRYYQSSHYSRKKEEEEREFISRNFRNANKYKQRKGIQIQIVEDYPHFGELELKFLSSVIFIQRKWREHSLYREIFKYLASGQKISQLSFEQSNSTQLNISYNQRSPEKLAPKYRSDLEVGSSQSYPIAMPKTNEQRQNQSREKLKEQQAIHDKMLKNNIYLQLKERDESREQQDPLLQIRHRMQQEPLQYELPEQIESSFSARSHKYEFLQRQLFPSMSYLLIKQYQLKQQLNTKLHQCSELQRIGSIDGKEYKKLRAQLEQLYEKEMIQLNKSKKDMKKGYLSFIDTYKDIKQQSGLRRVSSESGPMALLYKRIFNLQGSLKTPSQSSESMKRLTKKVLIRRQFYNIQKTQPNILHATIQNTQSARDYIIKQETAALSARIINKSQFFHYDAAAEPEPLRLNRIKQGFVVSPQNQLITPEQSPEYTQIRMKQDSYYERQEQHVMEEVIATLTHELFVQLIKIDERRQSAVEITSEVDPSRGKIKASEIRDFQIIQERENSLELERYDGRQQDFEIVQESKFREIFKIEGLSERAQVQPNRKHRNSNTYSISPVVSEPIPFEAQEIITYATELFAYINKIKIEESLMTKLNSNQGFTPKQYLKFLRDYQIPDEDYEPLISNQIFVEWEDSYYSGHQMPAEDEIYTKRQAAAIFHRCIFECMIGFLEDQRPSGDKGEPFPWQNVIYFKRVLTFEGMSNVFQQCLSKLEGTIQFRSGIIEEKHMILSEQDLQRVHEQNEDKIISMLQRQLEVSPDNWYQLEQHCLQIKLEIQLELFEYIMLQSLDEFLQLL